MNSYRRVLIVVGGTAVVVWLAIALIFAQTSHASASLQTDVRAAFTLQALGDRLLLAEQGQREALGEYLYSKDPRPLARYWRALTDEIEVADQVRTGEGDLTGIADALADVTAENVAWRATIADPAIAAAQSGSIEALKAAIEIELADHDGTAPATGRFMLLIDATVTDLGVRSEELNSLRITAAVFGLGIELLAAVLSLWFVRRFGLAVARDTRRRVRASAERIEIVASLRTLRTRETPEATAKIIAAALLDLPGVDVAGVLECTERGLRALAVDGLPGFPIQTGDDVPEGRAGYLRDRSDAGPWAEPYVRPAEPTEYHQRIEALGIKSQAFAPIRADGEIIGLIALGTTDEDNGHRLVEDLPAVGQFASVAETVLAPALVARRDRAEKRRRTKATISSAAFRPVFQPIVDLSTGATLGFEALTRFDDGSRPDVQFAVAVECGMGLELERATIEAAVREARHLPPGTSLSLNVSPALLAQEGTLAQALAHRSGRVVLEVTEHEAIQAYAPLREAMLRLGPGVDLAVDDVGAGVANFNHLVELRPDFIKIDIGLVRGVDSDSSRRAVVVGLIHFAAETGCQVIAEGIETPAERATLIELGVTLGQGYLLARPAPAEAWSAAIHDTDQVARKRSDARDQGAHAPPVFGVFDRVAHRA